VASALLAGFVLGLAVAASPGAMGLLCIRRTLTSYLAARRRHRSGRRHR
jgi:threonine/homoserine/homoserine lactone efflux protein